MGQDPEAKVMLRGYLDVPPERLPAVRAALATHIALTRAEEGCIAFTVKEDASCAGRLLVSEIFKNQTAFEAHQERTRSSAWFDVTRDIPRHYDITKDTTEPL